MQTQPQRVACEAAPCAKAWTPKRDSTQTDWLFASLSRCLAFSSLARSQLTQTQNSGRAEAAVESVAVSGDLTFTASGRVVTAWKRGKLVGGGRLCLSVCVWGRDTSDSMPHSPCKRVTPLLLFSFYADVLQT